MQHAMQMQKPKRSKFKLEPRYAHHRSDGLTHRRNAGSKLQEKPPASLSE